MAEDRPDHTVPAASRASVYSVERKVDDLSAKVLTLSNALMGVPGLSDGVITDVRNGLKQLDERLISMQAAMPSQINAAIDEKIKNRTVQRVTGTRSWITNVASSSVAVAFGVILNIIWLHLGGGTNPPLK